MAVSPSSDSSLTRIYWTAFIGLFFDYYDLYLFVYLAGPLSAHFGLTPAQSNWLQFAGLASVGVGALLFGYLADRWGRGRMMLVVFAVYLLGIAGISLAGNYASLLGFRLLASLALGAEWGISHTYLAERVDGLRRYRYAALLQFSILGGLLAALAARWALPVLGWRWLFAASILPVAMLSLVRWRALSSPPAGPPPGREFAALGTAIGRQWRPFLLCFGLASLTIASGTMNVFYAKELPQSPFYTVLFWANVAPGMLLGAWVVRRWGVQRAMAIYAVGLLAASLIAWESGSDRASLGFALFLPLLNGIPYGLMGAYFNEAFGAFRTMLSGAAYNLGRILAGFAPVLITALGLQDGRRYFLFSAVLGLGVLGLAGLIARGEPGRTLADATD
ncbi:MAG: MFS transporter [Opitutae bacterium]